MSGQPTDPDDGVVGWLLTGPRLDAAVVALSVLMVFGVAMDFRAHASGISFAEEGFFTPEHVFFYSAFLLIAGTIGAATVRRRRAGAAWVAAVPTGYGWGIVGVLAFGLGGIADFGWHGAFGFEEGLEALVSPSHLLLATGAVVFLSSPLRAAIRRDERPTGLGTVPAVLSATLAVTIVALFSAYVNPYARPTPLMQFGQSWIGPNLALAAWAFYPLLMVGVSLLLVRHLDPVPGSLVAVFLVPAAASTVLGDEVGLVLSAALAGVVAELLAAWRRPVPENALAMRLFGAAVPGVMAAGYFGLVALGPGIGWVVHLWTGTIVVAGMAGLLLTYVVVPDAAAARGWRNAGSEDPARTGSDPGEELVDADTGVRAGRGDD